VIEDRVVLYQRPQWLVLVGLIFCVGFVALFWHTLAIGAPATRRYSHEVSLLLGSAFLLTFSALSFLLLLELINPTRLFATPEGFGRTGCFAHPVVSWGEVDQFVLWRAVSGNPFADAFALTNVGYRLTEQGRGRHGRWWRRLGLRGACDGWLMSARACPARALYEELEARRWLV